MTYEQKERLRELGLSIGMALRTYLGERGRTVPNRTYLRHGDGFMFCQWRAVGEAAVDLVNGMGVGHSYGRAQ